MSQNSCQNTQCIGYRSPLPTQAKFCPICGSPLYETEVTTKAKADVNSLNAMLSYPIIDNFFPLKGIFLGKTRIENLDKTKYRIEKYDNEYVTGMDGVTFFTPRSNNDTKIVTAYISDIQEIDFDEWDNIGFNKKMSFEEFRSYFEQRGFMVTIARKPMISVYEHNNYFHAGLKAVANDKSISFILDFLGDGRTTPSSNNSLSSIKVSTDPSINIESTISGQILKIWN